METVHVLAVVYRLDDLLLGNVLGQRQLHDESVHVGIGIEFVHLGQQFFFGHIGLIANQRGLESALFAGFHFVGHVCLAAAVVAHQNGGQMRAFASGCHNLCHFGRYLLFDLCRDGFSVD